MSSAAAPTNNGANSNNAAETTPVERRCENSDCNASKLLSIVPKRKTQQFITDPSVMEKPMLINGFTTVFQVDGSSAKLSDLKNVPSANPVNSKFIYRIVPNTHAHIVNYVVVDAEGESLRKINESDPATMRKLLESQKVSADQMLKKLTAGVSVAVGANTTGANTGGPGGGVGTGGVGVATGAVTSPAVPILTNSQAKTTPNVPSKLSTSVNSSLAATPTAPVPAPVPIQTIPPPPPPTAMPSPQIKLPMRMHPNLKITAVASADTVSAMKVVPPTPPSSVQGTAAPSIPPPTVPLITPVPLAALQCPPPVLMPQRTSLPPLAIPQQQPSGSIVDSVDKPVFDKMQAELQELRRTVALLAEAQAKNNMSQQQSPSPSLSAPLPPQVVPVQMQPVPVQMQPLPVQMQPLPTLPKLNTGPIIAKSVTTAGISIRGGKRLRQN